jgi:hypothetical protein
MAELDMLDLLGKLPQILQHPRGQFTPSLEVVCTWMIA